MNYLKSLFINFLIVFFADHMLPGLTVIDQTKLPHIGGDLITAFALGLLNASIFPVLNLFQKEVSALKIALVSFILNFAAYAVIKIAPVGISITSVEGYVLVSFVVSIGSFCTNFLDLRKSRAKREEPFE